MKSQMNKGLVIVAIVVAACIGCLAFGFILQTFFPSSVNPATNPTQTPRATETSVPTTKSAEEYVEEYGGSMDAYIEILAMTDCIALQEKFDVAYANNQREIAGTEEFSWTVGFMTATDDRMQAAGCYDTLLPTSTPVPLSTRTPSHTETLPPNCLASYPSFCILPGNRIPCDQLPSEFIVLPPDPLGYDGDGDGFGCEE